MFFEIFTSCLITLVIALAAMVGLIASFASIAGLVLFTPTRAFVWERFGCLVSLIFGLYIIYSCVDDFIQVWGKFFG